jgi:hypothetical protein
MGTFLNETDKVNGVSTSAHLQTHQLHDWLQFGLKGTFSLAR